MIGAKLARVPVIIHGEHGTIQDKSININVQRVFWNMTDQVLSISDALKKQLVKKIGFPESKVKAVMNGVDLQRFSNSSPKGNIRALLGIPSHFIVIGTVGRLEPVKGHATFLKAISILLKKYSQNAKAILVGEGF